MVIKYDHKNISQQQSPVDSGLQGFLHAISAVAQNQCLPDIFSTGVGYRLGKPLFDFQRGHITLRGEAVKRAASTIDDCFAEVAKVAKVAVNGDVFPR